MNVARYLVDALLREGVETIFGYPGGAMLPFYDALYDVPALKHVLVRHEQAAAMAADGYARSTGKVGVCVSTSGPGATNLVTGIANAYLDSIPMVAIAGQVSSTAIGTDAFQEVDTIGITMPVVKHSYSLRSPADAPFVVAEAFKLACSRRPGPVFIELPRDIASSDMPSLEPKLSKIDPLPMADLKALSTARELMKKSARPVLYVGGGVRAAGAAAQLRRFVDAAGVPTVATLQGLGALPGRHPLFLGMLGMHGAKAANSAVQECDLLICAGARFDDRVTGVLEKFAPDARVIHLDIDPSEMGRIRRPDAAVIGDLKGSLAGLTQDLSVDSWRKRCVERRDKLTVESAKSPLTQGGPALLFALSNAAPSAVISSDVGQHQMWVAQCCRFERPENHLSSGGLGAMGYGLPAAVGAQLGRPGELVVSVSGDGSIMMNLQELATINRYRLPIKIIVMDNGTLGMVRQWQELFLERRYSEVDLWDNPDFVGLAKAFNIPGFKVTPGDSPVDAVARLLSYEGPALMHVIIDPADNVWPIVPPGRSLSEMLEGGAA